MLAWGAVLMLVGALSFVLPMFGRQFIVVSLLGLTGAGSAGAGLLFMAVGAYLFHLGKEQGKKEDSAHRQQILDIVYGKTPTPETHVRCPDCQKLVPKETHLCKYCGCKLIPQP